MICVKGAKIQFLLQNVIRKVYDPDTGRHRLVKGSGEIIEEIVSHSRHKDVNRYTIYQIFRYLSLIGMNNLTIYNTIVDIIR